MKMIPEMIVVLMIVVLMIGGISLAIVISTIVYLFRKNIADLIDALTQYLRDKVPKNKYQIWAEEMSKIARKEWFQVRHCLVTEWANKNGLNPTNMGKDNFRRCLQELGVSEKVINILTN